MKKSGLEELEALSLDWNPGPHLLSMSILWGCDDINILSPKQESKFFNPKKKIQEDVDLNSPFTIQYNYGYLR